MNHSLAIVFSALLVAGCASPSPSRSSAPPRSPPPSVGASRSQAEVSELAWHRVELPNGEGAHIGGVAAGEHDVIIVGSRGVLPVAWTSHDGGPWALEELEPKNADAGTALVYGNGFLVVGGRQTNKCAQSTASVFWIRSADGRWTLAPFDKLFCGAGPYLSAVSGQRAAVFSIGSDELPVAWFSDTGLKWVGRPIRRDILPGALAPVAGGFAAVGRFGEEGPQWFGRSDGRDGWTIAALFDKWPEPEHVGLADRGSGFIIWFADSARAITAFVSQTGDAWQSIQTTGLSGVQVDRVSRIRSGYVAFAFGPADESRLFVSRDGVTWRGVPAPPESGSSAFESVGVSGDDAILLTNENPGSDLDITAVWAAPASLFEP